MKDAVDVLNERIAELMRNELFIADLKAEIERLKSHLEDIRAEAESDYHKDGKRIAELEAQRKEDADLIEAQKREIEVLHGIRDEAERLRHASS